VTLREHGATVAVASRHATRIHVSIFEGGKEVARLPLPERLGDVHSGVIPELRAGMHYGLRAEGPWAPEAGHRFDMAKLLLDPYATEITAPFAHHPDLMRQGAETSALVPRAIAGHAPADAAPLPPHRPSFIYEIPAKAFTRLHPGVPPERCGTVAALAEPVIIDHLTRLGADTVELMPLTAWIDERHLPALGLANAWGYNPVSFMAPDPRLAPGGLAEIRAAVSALHEAGIRVVLDMVFNHTGESDVHGTTLSLRGLDHALYYRHAGGMLVNDTGCGNTLALDEPIAIRLVMDAMRSWVTRTGIDGFRFDLATVLGRRASGFDAHAPLLAAIEQDPLLSRLIMIAEPWDVGPGGHRLGQFPARWQEWNDRYRDDIRRFWRGGPGMAGAFATRIAGSSDIFAARHRPPSAGINFLAAHDGFTLHDAVTYPAKRNHANGEDNRDGSDHEPTWPGGDVKALLATLFLSRGTLMLTAGDEFGRTQQGNNNAYAQDNATTWLDWETADLALAAFTAGLSRLRRDLHVFLDDRFLTGDPAAGGLPDAEWIGADGGAMDWHDPHASVIGLVLAVKHKRIALVFNRGEDHAQAVLPRRAAHRWERLFSSGEGSGLPPASVSVFAEERIAAAGVADEEVAALARAAGIEGEWWEVDGTHHRVSPETERTLLAAMGLAHVSPEDVEHSMRVLGQPRPIIAGASDPVTLGAPSPRRRRFMIEDDQGNAIALDVPPGEVAVTRLAPGRYRLRAEEDLATPRDLIVSPGTCHVPDDIAHGARVFGIAAHLYALRHASSEGIGDFETLRRFAQLTREEGGRYAGLNPLHHMFPADRGRASPYQPSDRHYIDPIYISIAGLLEWLALPQAARLAGESRAAFASLDRLPHVDYAAVWEAKRRVLEQAFAEFPGSAAFDDFIAAGGAGLTAHGRFEAERMGESPTPRRIAFRAFLQWIADHQLGAAAVHDSLYRDLALGCAYDGGEIAGEPTAFATGVSIGAPPDPFSAAGQVWNLPPYSPLALLQQGLEPVRRVMAANMRHAAALRIDHVLGFARQFWVPRGAEGRHGAYVRFPLDGLLAVTALESRRNRCLVVGEDLGTVPEGLRERLAQADVFSYRVLWFEREGRGFRRPEAYPARALACLASHDLPTFAGWRRGRDIAIGRELGQIGEEDVPSRMEERAREIALLDDLAGSTGGGEAEASAAAHGLIARTPSRIMLIQADDLAGETGPLNVPGTDREWPNWRRRVSTPVESLTQPPLARGIIARVKEERSP
jgi:glycogen operon protein